ncbi:MAG: hypothetical protein WKF31_00490 [Thermoleophilaceae bacterium]
MNFRTLSRMAKQVVDQRGGTEAVKADAARLKDIARGQGTLSEKGKRAAEALRQPGGGRGTDARRTEAGHPEEHHREEHHREERHRY